MIKTVDNAGLILRKSWTVKLSVLATVLELFGVLWPTLEPHLAVVLPQSAFHILAALCVAAIPVARVIKQSNMP